MAAARQVLAGMGSEMANTLKWRDMWAFITVKGGTVTYKFLMQNSYFKCMCSLSEEITPIFTYLLPFSRGIYSQRKNLLLLEQILSFKNKPLFGRAMSAREANRKSQRLFPLVQMTANMEVYLYTLREE